MGIFGDDAFATGAQEQEAGGKTKSMAPPEPILALWQLPSVKLSRGGKRSAIEAFNDNSDLWEWCLVLLYSLVVLSCCPIDGGRCSRRTVGQRPIRDTKLLLLSDDVNPL